MLLVVTSSLSVRIHLACASFLSLGCPGIYARVSRRFSLSSPSPTAIRLFPLGRSPLGSWSSLGLSFYPFGVFHRLCLLPLDFALDLLFLRVSYLLLGLSACVVIYSFVRFLALGDYDRHVLSPSLCHLADPADLMRVIALPPLNLSAPPFSLDSCHSDSRSMVSYVCGLFRMWWFLSCCHSLEGSFEFFFRVLHSLISLYPSISLSVCARL